MGLSHGPCLDTPVLFLHRLIVTELSQRSIQLMLGAGVGIPPILNGHMEGMLLHFLTMFMRMRYL